MQKGFLVSFEENEALNKYLGRKNFSAYIRRLITEDMLRNGHLFPNNLSPVGRQAKGGDNAQSVAIADTRKVIHDINGTYDIDDGEYENIEVPFEPMRALKRNTITPEKNETAGGRE